MVAIRYAARFPGQVRSLVLVGAQVRPPRAIMAMQVVILRLVPARAFAGRTDAKDRMRAVLRGAGKADLTAYLASLTMPTLVVCGARDRFNLAAAQALSQLIPSARLELADGCGHEVNTEDPERLAALVADFHESL